MEETTKMIADKLKKSLGIQTIYVSPDELLILKIGPITQEVKGPAEIIINYD